MNFSDNRNLLRWVIVIASFIVISLILWNTYDFFQKFKAEERNKMQIWSLAQSDFLGNLDDLESDVNTVTSYVLTEASNSVSPMMMVSSDGKFSYLRNIDTTNVNNPQAYLKRLSLKFERENQPIDVKYQNIVYGKIVYGNSPLLNKLKYYPLALLLIILLFVAVAFFFYRSSKNAAQNKLWTGMAKETAHQIGTPLSSLVGWTEILRSENVDPDHIKEIEKDIDRLQTITDRFSKIGSIPKLERTDIVQATRDSYDYLKSRSSKLIDFEFIAPQEAIYVDLNMQLYSWTIENLVKNAIDAMRGKGQLKIEVNSKDKYVNVAVTDSGKGIPKQLYKKIFDPGFTSKKRGWGLGLSLAKRIIEDYHKGKIKVVSSEIGKGSVLRLSLQRLEA